MAKKLKQAKEVKSEDKLSLENIKVGDKILDLHDEEVEITSDIIEQMRRYEQESNKLAIYRGKISGKFLFFKYYEDHPEEKYKSKKSKKVEESNEEEMESEVDEENILKDAMEDYKSKFGIKKVNTNTKKFKAFFEEWKNSN